MALVEKINDVNLVNDHDMIRWTLEGSDNYSAKSMFQKMTKASPKVNQSISTKIQRRLKFFGGPYLTEV